MTRLKAKSFSVYHKNWRHLERYDRTLPWTLSFETWKSNMNAIMVSMYSLGMFLDSTWLTGHTLTSSWGIIDTLYASLSLGGWET